MEIYYQQSKTAYYPLYLIDKILLIIDSTNNLCFEVYISGVPQNYILATIDSINIIQTVNQAITIGTQVWMIKNLDVDHYRNGDSIPEVRDSATWANLTTGAWCYYHNSDSLGAIYGKLYNWYAVNDLQGLAPTGRHVPSYSEWTILSTFLGSDSISNEALKEAGTAHWFFEGGTNSSGFTALPGGFRNFNGSFDDITDFLGIYGAWWSSTENDDSDALLRIITISSYPTLNMPYGSKEDGCSVRCLKD